MRKVARTLCIDGENFDSEAEYARYCILKLREKNGEIEDLRRQVHFELAPKGKGQYRAERALEYVADFTYRENGELVVEDVKPRNRKGDIPANYKKTPAWRIYVLKRKIMLSRFGISIKET